MHREVFSDNFDDNVKHAGAHDAKCECQFNWRTLRSSQNNHVQTLRHPAACRPGLQGAMQHEAITMKPAAAPSPTLRAWARAVRVREDGLLQPAVRMCWAGV